ncbi:unnamed protein product, partial [Closterium sp. NIES-54]
MLALCREHRLEHRTKHRTKHIALRYFLSRELQQRGQLRLAYVASEANTADIFTKALAPGDHQRFCTLLGFPTLRTAAMRTHGVCRCADAPAVAQQRCFSQSNMTQTFPRAAARGGGKLLPSQCRRPLAMHTTSSRGFFASRKACYAVIVLLAAVLASGSVAVAAPRKEAAQSYRCSANPAVASVAPKYANRFFRLISTLLDASTGDVVTELFAGRNWVEDSRLEPVLALRSDGKCKSSWAITAVSAVEMAYALVASATPSMDPPQRISVQQVLECRSSANSNCAAGGWPTAALDYMVDATTQWGGLATEAGYAYTQKDGKCNRNKVKQQATAIGITGYDQVDFYGWLGLLLAVNVQPTIAFVRGSYPSFQTYTDGIYCDQGCAAAGVVDHSVVVMGYSISVNGAYWILRNSWGSKWGMQLAGVVMGWDTASRCRGPTGSSAAPGGKNGAC